MNWAEERRGQRKVLQRGEPGVQSLCNEEKHCITGDLEAGLVADGREGGGDGKKPGWRGGLGPDDPGPARPHEDKKKPLKAFEPAWGDMIESVLCKPHQEKPQTERPAERGPRWTQGASSVLPGGQARDSGQCLEWPGNKHLGPTHIRPVEATGLDAVEGESLEGEEGLRQSQTPAFIAQCSKMRQPSRGPGN